MAYTVSINGTTRTSDILTGSIRTEDVINDKQNTCSFKLIDRSGSGIPSTDQEVIITLSDGTVLFGGYILSVEMTQQGLGEVIASIRCIDYVRLLDRNLVHASYESMTCAEIIQEIVDTYCPSFGITTTNVQTGPTVDQISFNYVQVSQAMRKLADLSGYNWYIDYNKDIHFFPTTTNTAPFNIVDTTLEQISETMASSPSGTLGGVATYDSANRRVVLTTAAGSQNGRLEYNKTFPSRFTVEAVFQAGGGTGADALYFYWGASSSPTSEDDAIGGYLVAMDEWTDEIQLKFNGTTIASTSYSNLDNNSRRTLRIEVNVGTSTTNIKVYVDKQNGNAVIIDFTEANRTLGSTKCGVGARTGGSHNNHYCYYLQANGTNTDYTSLKISKDASQIKNRVYVRGGTKLSDTTTYEEKGDGKKVSFTLPDKPHDITVAVNGVSKTVGIKNVNLTGYDWYVNFQEKYVEQDSGGSLLGTGDTLTVTYKYDIPILVALEDTTSILASGVKEFAIFDKSITTTQAARDRASAELTDYANSIIEGSFDTHTNGFASGQYLTINLADYGVNANYIIQSVTASSYGGGNFVYSVNIASAKTMGIIRFLIELLEANKNLIELDDNEVVDELFSITDSLLSDSLTDLLTIDSAGPYATWCTASESTPTTRARWDLFQWG